MFGWMAQLPEELIDRIGPAIGITDFVYIKRCNPGNNILIPLTCEDIFERLTGQVPQTELIVVTVKKCTTRVQLPLSARVEQKRNSQTAVVVAFASVSDLLPLHDHPVVRRTHLFRYGERIGKSIVFGEPVEHTETALHRVAALFDNQVIHPQLTSEVRQGDYLIGSFGGQHHLHADGDRQALPLFFGNAESYFLQRRKELPAAMDALVCLSGCRTDVEAQPSQ